MRPTGKKSGGRRTQDCHIISLWQNDLVDLSHQPRSSERPRRGAWEEEKRKLLAFSKERRTEMAGLEAINMIIPLERGHRERETA